MSRPRRSSVKVLRDMAKHDKEQKDATESTSEASEDRTGTSARPTSSESRPETTSASKETNPVTDETAGGLAGDDSKEIVKSSTKAAAIVKEPEREFAVCPRCHERRYKPEQVGTTVVCINCRASVVLT